MSFFGVNSPLRLLRENWRNPKMLAEELYAMFTSQEPVVHQGQVEIRVPRGETGLRIVQEQRPAETTGGGMTAGRARTAASATPASPQFDQPASKSFQEFLRRPAPVDPARPSRRLTVAAQPDRPPFKPYEAPAFEVKGPVAFSGSPVQFSSRPQILNQSTGVFESIPIQAASAAVDNPIAVFGVVQSGTGGTWMVLIPDPDSVSFAAPNTGDQVVVEVTVPNVGDSEVAPAGVTVGPVLGFLDDASDTGRTYYYQPPVWLP